MQASGDNFILSFARNGVVYPVALTDEQREMFNLSISLIPGEIKVVNTPIGKAMTLKEFKEMKEGK
jgi:hypothetical protein